MEVNPKVEAKVPKGANKNKNKQKARKPNAVKPANPKGGAAPVAEPRGEVAEVAVHAPIPLPLVEERVVDNVATDKVKKPVAAQAGPAPVIAEVRPKPVLSLRAFWANFRHVIPIADEPLAAFAALQGWKVTPLERPLRAHGIAHLARAQALLGVLLSEASSDQRVMSMLDWYGSPRSKRFDPSTFNHKGLSLNVRVAPDVAVQGDACRSMERREAVRAEERFDVVVMTDVYQSGPDYKLCVGPDTVKELIVHSKTGWVYMIARSFEGDLGTDGESVWYREDGLIVFSPDETSNYYGAHPDIPWLRERTYQGLDITYLENCGPFGIWRLALTLPNAIQIGAVVSPSPKISYQDIDRTFLWGYLKIPFMSTKVLVHKQAALVHGHYAQKVASGVLWDAAYQSIRNYLSKDKEMAVVSKRMPAKFEEMVEGTVYYSIFGQRQRRAEQFGFLRNWLYPLEERMVRDRAPTLSSVGGGSIDAMKKFLFYSALASLALYHRKSTSEVGRFIIKLLIKLIRGFQTAATLALSGVSSAEQALALIPGAVVPKFSIISAVGEEVLNMKSPMTARALFVGEFAINAQKNLPAAFATLGMHVICDMLHRKGGKWGRVFAFGLHVMWNYIAEQKRHTRMREARFLEFKEAYEGGSRLETGSIQLSVPGKMIFKPYVSKISDAPKNFRGTCEISVDGVGMSAKKAFEVLPEEEGKNRVYGILVTHRLLPAPANVARNLLAAILHRTHNDPFVGYDDASERHERWRKLTLFCKDLGFYPTIERIMSMEEACAIMGKKGNRIMNAFKADYRGDVVKLKKNITLKSNETITADKEVDGILTMKPRAIINLDAVHHSRSTRFARAVGDIFHSVWDGCTVYQVGRFTTRFIMACGFTQEELNAIPSFFANGTDVVVVVSGDDSVSYINPASGLCEGGSIQETDFSMCDQSEDEGPCKVSTDIWMKSMGVPPEQIADVQECCSKAYTASKGLLYVTGEAGWQMPTGIVYTTNFNSHNNVLNHVHWLLRNQDESVPIEVTSKELGFKCKAMVHENLADATFLKGWWVASESGETIWYPLPSAVIKLGKIMSDPVVITAVKRGKRKTYFADRVAVKIVAGAMASSLGNIDPSYPILGKMLSTLRRLGKESATSFSVHEDRGKTHCEGIIDRGSALSQLESRYGITELDVLRVEKLFDEIVELPAYIEDPVFDALADKDYGGDSVSHSLAGSDFQESAEGQMFAGNVFACFHEYLSNRPGVTFYKYFLDMMYRNYKTKTANKAAHALGSAMGFAYRNKEAISHAAKSAAVIGASIGAQKVLNLTRQGKSLRGSSTFPSYGDKWSSNSMMANTSMTSAPVSRGYTSVTSAPRISSGKSGYTITHRELVNGSIAGSTTFTRQVLAPINPGLSSFPWVASIANQFEQWHGNVRFVYVPVAPTSAKGDVAMYVDYNVYDPTPTTETQALDHVGCVTAPIWTSSSFICNTPDMFPTGAKKYIRNANVVGDKRLYDGGNFFLFTNNCADTTVIGKLFVEYTFQFFVPQLEPPVILPTLVSEYFTLAGTQTFPTGADTLFNPTITWTVGLDGLSLGNGVAGLISLPAGAYNVSFQSFIKDSLSEALTITASFAINGVENAFESAVALTPPAGGGVPVFLTQTISIPSGGATLSVRVTAVGAAGVITLGANTSRLTITQV